VYSPRQVAEIVGLPESRVRYWAQTGLVGPSERRGGRATYSFSDLVALKACKQLTDAGVPSQRLRKTLEAVRSQLPGVTQPLAELRLVGDGDRVIMVRDGSRYEPVSGQLLFDLDVGSLAAAVGELKTLPEDTAWTRFEDGLALERAGQPDAARAAWERALALDPSLAAAHTNLGHLAFAAGRSDEARAAWERALALDPSQPEAHFNLGNWHDAAGDAPRALAEWFAALAADDTFAAAHFQVGAVLAESGAADRARTHLLRYLELAPDGEAAAEARRLLEEVP
jgi:tetratricopeptide (TPR) repeat protein